MTLLQGLVPSVTKTDGASLASYRRQKNTTKEKSLVVLVFWLKIQHRLALCPYGSSTRATIELARMSTLSLTVSSS